MAAVAAQEKEAAAFKDKMQQLQEECEHLKQKHMKTLQEELNRVKV